MTIPEVYHAFLDGLRGTTPVEFVAVIAGITCVWFSKKENILVYPIGLINTIFYIYISVKGRLFGEASVNIYYTVMSIYGWILWAKKDEQKKEARLHVTYSTGREWTQQLLFFGVFYVVIFVLLTWLKENFAPGAIP